MLRILLVMLILFCLPLLCLGQYEGQVIVTYDGPSQYAPVQGGYTGGSSGGMAGYYQQAPVMVMASGGSSGGYAGAGGSAGGYGGYGYAPQRYATPVYNQPQPRRFFGGGGFGFNVGAGVNWGGGGGRMVCGPNGCYFQ